MQGVEVEKADAEGLEEFKKIKLSDYTKQTFVSQHRKDSEITLCQREPFSKEGHHEYHPLHFSQDMVDQSFFTHGLQLFFQDFSIKTSSRSNHRTPHRRVLRSCHGRGS